MTVGTHVDGCLTATNFHILLTISNLIGHIQIDGIDLQIDGIDLQFDGPSPN